jgi:hypothetical protein
MANLATKPGDLSPTGTDTFHMWGGMPGFNVEDLVSDAAVNAVADSFTSSNRAHEGWARYEERGRVDARNVWRSEASGSRFIFKDKRAPSATRVRLVILVDASGWMGGRDAHVEGRDEAMSRREAAAVFAATIVKGLGSIPTVRVEVIQHDFGYMTVDGARVGYGRRDRKSAIHTVNLRRAWEPGTPVAFMNQMPTWMPGGGNADGHAIEAVVRYLKASLLPGEVPMIMVLSDGEPANVGKDPDWDGFNALMAGESSHVSRTVDMAGLALRSAVDAARTDGVHVLSVAIAGGDQDEFYGAENIVRFDGNWVTLADQLATLVGRTVGTAYQQGADNARFDW